MKSVSLQEIGDGSSARASEREDGVAGSAFLTAVLMWVGYRAPVKQSGGGATESSAGFGQSLQSHQ